jgi:hypothetical protein
MVLADLDARRVAPPIIGRRAEADLHRFADLDVLALGDIALTNARLDELGARARPEEELEVHAAAFGPGRLHPISKMLPGGAYCDTLDRHGKWGHGLY